MHATNQTNNNSSTSPIDLTFIYTLSIVKIKSIGNQTNSPKIRKDSNNHLRKLRQRPFQAAQPVQIYNNQVPIVPQRTGFNLVQQPPIHWIPVQIPAHHHNHQMHYNVNNYSMVQTQEQQLYLQQHVFLPPNPRGPHAQPLHLAKLVRRPQLVRM
ncbi:2448_t:CDS:2 [Funneliformis caledonium]|uniref:2448_t:CDS:1 n=1 Tax=Funneliformis caledonium TaxID=1117310 RepID=A0A9N9BVB3_9GLOM|nr:2448_t:CDS:2 [Funneliformis caledonium]